jgi:hypothetical protein
MMMATGIFFLIGYALGAGHIILLHYLKDK